MNEIRNAAPRDAIITVDGEITMATARQVLQSFGPATRLNSGTNACIGTGVPFAIGAQLARPEATVISVNGDSAFGFNGMEIETALRHNLPVIFIVDNNQGILGSTLEQGLFGDDYPERVGMYVPEARYDKVMDAFGGHAEHVERPEEIGPALQRALAGRPRGADRRGDRPRRAADGPHGQPAARHGLLSPRRASAPGRRDASQGMRPWLCLR